MNSQTSKNRFWGPAFGCSPELDKEKKSYRVDNELKKAGFFSKKRGGTLQEDNGGKKDPLPKGTKKPKKKKGTTTLNKS